MNFRTHPKDLSAQKLGPSAPSYCSNLMPSDNYSSNLPTMQNQVNLAKVGIPLALLMLAGWGVATFAFEAPGWVHLILTAGVFLLIYAIVARGTPRSDD